jgi:hypothetical protein
MPVCNLCSRTVLIQGDIGNSEPTLEDHHQFGLGEDFRFIRKSP